MQDTQTKCVFFQVIHKFYKNKLRVKSASSCQQHSLAMLIFLFLKMRTTIDDSRLTMKQYFTMIYNLVVRANNVLYT